MLIVTRPAAQAQPWLRRLADQGVPAVALPLIGIGALEDGRALAELHEAARSVANWHAVMFVSANAVEHFFAARWAAAGEGARAGGGGRGEGGDQASPQAWPAATLAACTGEGTRAALLAQGVAPAQIRAPAAGGAMDSEALWAQLRGDDWAQRRVLVVRGEDGRDWLADQWRERGAHVQFLAAYRRCRPQLSASEQAVLAAACAAPRDHLWLFSSSEALRHLGDLAAQGPWGDSAALATHARIGEAARRLGFGSVQVVSPELTDVVGGYRAWRAGAHGG